MVSVLELINVSFCNPLGVSDDAAIFADCSSRLDSCCLLDGEWVEEVRSVRTRR
jgi:hypothetical protein